MEGKCHTQTEIWKDVPDYEGYYKISGSGEVVSLNYLHTGKERVIKPYKRKNGYVMVLLSKNGHHKNIQLHRLVAKTFIPIPEHLKEYTYDELQVDHINGVRDDCRVENLRWCTSRENNNFELSKTNRSKSLKISQNRPEVKAKMSESIKAAFARPEVKARRSTAQEKSVCQFTKEGVLITEFKSAKEASKQTGIHKSGISQCCNGKYKSAGGYIWRFAV